METKLSQVRNAAGAGQWEQAICLAAKFPNLGDETSDIRRAADCIKHPDFYKQLKKDIPTAIEAGKQALIKKYKFPQTA